MKKNSECQEKNKIRKEVVFGLSQCCYKVATGDNGRLKTCVCVCVSREGLSVHRQAAKENIIHVTKLVVLLMYTE